MTEAHASQEDTAAHSAGQELERARIVAYLAFHETAARSKADAADNDTSRNYQSLIANSIKAMREAIAGEFHWRADL